jgi:Flp pilus assembly protein TadB
MTALGVVFGAILAAALLLLVRELAGRNAGPGTPWRPLITGRLSRQARARGLFALAAGLIVLLVSGWPVAGVAAAAAVLFVPKLTTGSQKHAIEVLAGLEKWLRQVTDRLTSGIGLEEALQTSPATAPAAVAGPVTALASRLAAGEATDAALRAFAGDIGDPAGDRICAALIIAAGPRGGAVRNVLTALAALLARDVADRRAIEADRAQHRTTLRWIMVFTIAGSVFAVLNRSYSAPFDTFTGQAVLAAVAGLDAAGLAWLSHLGNVPSPGRFLESTPPGQPRARGPR